MGSLYKENIFTLNIKDIIKLVHFFWSKITCLGLNSICLLLFLLLRYQQLNLLLLKSRDMNNIRQDVFCSFFISCLHFNYGMYKLCLNSHLQVFCDFLLYCEIQIVFAFTLLRLAKITNVQLPLNF